MDSDGELGGTGTDESGECEWLVAEIDAGALRSGKAANDRVPVSERKKQVRRRHDCTLATAELSKTKGMGKQIPDHELFVPAGDEDGRVGGEL